MEDQPDIEQPGRGAQRGRGPRDAEGSQDTGNGALGVAIGFGNVLLYAVLPAVLFIAIWTMVSIYAIVKWAGAAPDQPNPVVLVVGIASLVVLIVVLISIAVGLLGRPMNPKKRAR